MIRAVLFDFYGTLAGWEPAAAEILRRAANMEGLEVDPVAIDRAYPTANALLDRENAIRRIAERTPTEQQLFFAQYEKLLLETAGYAVSLHKAADIWRHIRGAPKRVMAYPDALPALKALSEDGLKLGVISNMGRELPDYLDFTGLAQYVTVAVSSEEAGFAKPHPTIFEIALDRAQDRADEALFVGDSYEGDVLGSQSAGLHELFLQRDPEAKAPSDVPTVRLLTDVPAHVEGLNARG
jgi:putative hydrolase of the HAD superfamily